VGQITHVFAVVQALHVILCIRLAALSGLVVVLLDALRTPMDPD
jgi:hypothetical protein